ncbi:Mitochondrial translocator assembly and maintenance protein 41, partial [Quaeritorhiza haematococci]
SVPKSSSKPPMIDLVFGVTHPAHWHSLNIRRNPSDYSSFTKFGSGAVTYLQENFGGQIYYNPYVEVDGMVIKYGVVSIDHLLDDLKDWKTFYLAGRMQKPIKVLRDDARVHLANQTNLYNAVRTSLLLLPSEFTEEELFLCIAALSYKGDIRTLFVENPYKVNNIVYSQMDRFREIYRPILEDLPNVAYVRDSTLQVRKMNLKSNARKRRGPYNPKQLRRR